jgi:hypothetical protein
MRGKVDVAFLRRRADHRAGAWLQPVEYVGAAQALPGANGSVDCPRREARCGFFVRVSADRLITAESVHNRTVRSVSWWMPGLADEQATVDWPVIEHPLRVLFAAPHVSNVLAHRRTEGSPMRV